MPILRTALLLLSSVTLVACAAGDGPLTEPAADASVEIVDFAFAPARLEVPLGTTVTWTNRDDFAHTVTATDGGFDEPLGDPGAHDAGGTSTEIAFDRVGTYAYICDLHPSMTGEIVVVEG